MNEGEVIEPVGKKAWNVTGCKDCPACSWDGANSVKLLRLSK